MRIIPQWQKMWRYHAAVKEAVHIVPSVPPVTHAGSQQPTSIPNPVRIQRLTATAVNGRIVPDLVTTAGWFGPFQYSLDTVGTNVDTTLSGRFLWVMDSTPGANATLTFDDNPNSWPIYAGVVIPWPKPGFSKCYLSNTAQSNATITLASAFDLSLLAAIQGLNS